MHNPVEIVLRGVPNSGALERYIGEQADKLDRQCGRILACHVVAEALHRPKQQGAQYSVRLNITLAGTEVVVNREHGEDVYIALRDAFEAAGIQIKDHMRRQSDGRHRSRSGPPHARG
jgi:ribosome-associated translation inhibitor RaiA